MIRQAYSIQELRDLLNAQVEMVARHYAPEVPGSYTLHGKYFTLNPGRVDRNVGSFCIDVSGSKAGKWRDFATGQHGDLLDLIGLAMGCDIRGQLAEARAYLGLETASPEDRRRREDAARAARARRAEAERADRARVARRARQARAIWLSGQERIAGTPVEAYLRDRRGIDLSRLGRQPRALRYLPECHYEHIDPETGEVIEGKYPAMVASIVDRKGDTVAVHRTYLAIGSDGRWDKAPVPEPKKVLGSYRGAAIRLWRGTTPGPRGGAPAPLSRAPAGTRVYIAEGIEDGLSCALILRDIYVLAAISLANMGSVALPDTVTAVTLVADRDENEQARAQLERARKAHLAAGRAVAVWQNRHGGKDLNDALRAAMAAGGLEKGVA